MLSYRASLKTLDAEGAYLEMWCRLPGKGEFFSKGLNQTIKGTRDWSSFEIPFMLKQGQQADLVKLNLAFSGGGTVWIRDVELLQTPQGKPRRLFDRTLAARRQTWDPAGHRL
jgi:hypothetical protein